MKNTAIFLKILLLLLALSSCAIRNKRLLSDINYATFETKNISRGNNNPKIDISKNNLDLFLIALHYKIPIKDIEKHLGWSQSKTKQNIELLIKNKLLKSVNNIYIPSMAIFELDKGNLLIKKSQNIVNEIAESIKTSIPQIKKLHYQMDIAKKTSFDNLSFYYISDLLLDTGQIGNVEKDFLKKERPFRNGKYYYLALLEKDTTKNTEPYGIYGNQGLVNNDKIYIGVYGNKRVTSDSQWQNYKDKTLYYFNKIDFNNYLRKMPKIFQSELIEILERNKPYFKKIYIELGYDKEITFNEFFIWWYHFIYTETTKKLLKEQVIQKPKDGMFYYKIEK